MKARADQIILYRESYGDMAKRLAGSLGLSSELISAHRFPDGESYIRLPVSKMGEAWLFGSLFPPNERILELILASRSLKNSGVQRINLITPYLPYMRQDKAFRAGEAISAPIIAELLSMYVDHLITVDPHLHRINSLNDIYNCKTTVLHAAPYLATWISNNIINPVIVGPDSESQQWVSGLAKQLNAPFLVFKKKRTGDRSVSIDPQGITAIAGGSPVIVDDIISTGTTMAKAGALVFHATGINPIGMAVHGIFAGKARNTLLDAGFSQIITTNSIPGKSQQIDLVPLLHACLNDLIS